MVLFVILMCLSIAPKTSIAQAYIDGRRGFFDNWQVNINLGTNLFYGDIQQYRRAPYKEDWRMAYGIIFRKHFSPVFSLGFQLLNGKLHGTRFDFGGTDMYFDSDIFEYNVNTTIDLINMFFGYNPDRKVSIYATAGLGFSNWKTELKDYNTGKLIRSSGFTGKGPNHRTTEIVVPFGGGLKFNLGNSIGLNLESTLRPVNSDYLDAWKSGFKYDMYGYTSLGLSYNFNTIAGRDPAKQQAKYDKRMARQSDKEIRAYERMQYSEAQKSYQQQKYAQGQNYRQSQRSYNQAQQDLQYYNKKTRQDIQPSTADYHQYQQQQSLEAFWAKHSRGELPEVVEYDITGVYSRLKEETPVETYQTEDLMQYVMPAQETDIVEISPEQAPTPVYTYEQQTDREAQSRIFTDAPSEVGSTALPGIIYKVQILAKTDGRANTSHLSQQYGIIESIDEEQREGVYRYVIGEFKTYNEAVNFARNMKYRGITDAFVVAYKNGIRVSLRSILEQ